MDAEYTIPNLVDHSEDGPVLFKKSVCGKELNFEVYDSVRGFSKADWKRVVAVFVSGNDWEFRDWPKEETTISIFLKIKGFYLKYTETSPPKNVMKWNIRILDIHRNRRHLDVSIQNDFWTLLEDFLLQPRYREQRFDKKP